MTSTDPCPNVRPSASTAAFTAASASASRSATAFSSGDISASIASNSGCTFAITSSRRKVYRCWAASAAARTPSRWSNRAVISIGPTAGAADRRCRSLCHATSNGLVGGSSPRCTRRNRSWSGVDGAMAPSVRAVIQYPNLPSSCRSASVRSASAGTG